MAFSSDESNKGFTLDPEDWQEFAALAHQVLQDAIDYLRTVRERPVWRPVPEEVKRRLICPLPTEPLGAEAAYQEFAELIFPYATGNVHPRFFGWVHGSGTASGLLSGILMAAMNSNCGGRDHGGLYVERTVVAWCKEMFGYPESAGGLLVSGTSMANLLGLTVARQAKAGCDIRKSGLAGVPKPLVAYASCEAHQCISKAMEVMGLGTSALRTIAVDEGFRMRIDELHQAVARDQAAGYQPFCVVGSAGTVKTGAIDDLNSIADLCEREGIWFHVDGAFGGLCVLDETLRPRVRGIERSDSIGFDFHKWMHVPYEAGCILVRRGEEQIRTFTTRSDYLEGLDRGLAGGGVWPCDLGTELSRSFRALKVWFTIKEHGAARIGTRIRQNCEQAVYLSDRVRREPELRLLSEPVLNIVCLRFQPPGRSEEDVDKLNCEIVADLQESGVAVPSTASLNGRLAIRCNITNHRCQLEDFDVLVDAILAAGRKRVFGAAAL